MLLMGLYTVQWEVQALDREQRLAAAEQARLVRKLRTATASGRPKGPSRRQASALKRLVSALGTT